MLWDAQNMFCTEQEVTADAASTNLIDLSKARDIAVDNDLYVAINQFGTAAGAATVNIKLQVDDNSSFSSPTTVWESGSLAYTDLNGDYALKGIKMPHFQERYVRLYFDVTATSGQSLSGTKFKAGIVNGFDHAPLYDKAVHH